MHREKKKKTSCAFQSREPLLCGLATMLNSYCMRETKKKNACRVPFPNSHTHRGRRYLKRTEIVGMLPESASKIERACRPGSKAKGSTSRAPSFALGDPEGSPGRSGGSRSSRSLHFSRHLLLLLFFLLPSLSFRVPLLFSVWFSSSSDF